MDKDVSSRTETNSGENGDASSHSDHPAAPPIATSASPDAAGEPAKLVNGAATGSGQSAGFGNAGEQPDADPKGGDGSSLLAANLRKSSKP